MRGLLNPLRRRCGSWMSLRETSPPRPCSIPKTLPDCSSSNSTAAVRGRPWLASATGDEISLRAEADIPISTQSATLVCHVDKSSASREAPMPLRPNRTVLTLALCVLGVMAAIRSAVAEVTRIDFTSKQPYGTFRAGDYVIWEGRITGDLSA